MTRSLKISRRRLCCLRFNQWLLALSSSKTTAFSTRLRCGLARFLREEGGEGRGGRGGGGRRGGRGGGGGEEGEEGGGGGGEEGEEGEVGRRGRRDVIYTCSTRWRCT